MKGSVRKRGKTYTYTVDVGRDPITGKRQQISKGGFKTKKECQDALAKIITEYNQGTYVNESEITFKEFADKWLELYEKTGKKPGSVRARTTQSKALVKYFKQAKIKEITGIMYQDFLLSASETFAPNTLSGINTAAKMIFKKAIELKHIKHSPTEYAVLPKKHISVEELENDKELPKYYEKDELAKFLKLCKKDANPQAYIIFLLLSYTGIRVGELCALKWKDINLKENTIKIYKTYYNPNNKATEYQLLTPKTKTSNRIIYIDDDLVKELKKHKSWQNKIRLKIESWNKEDFVITKVLNYSGYPETTKEIRVMMARIVNKNNLKELTPHGLRHTHASLLAEAGVGLEEIMERLGHKDDDTTRTIYLHVTQDMKKEAPQKFSELMKNL